MNRPAAAVSVLLLFVSLSACTKLSDENVSPLSRRLLAQQVDHYYREMPKYINDREKTIDFISRTAIPATDAMLARVKVCWTAGSIEARMKRDLINLLGEHSKILSGIVESLRKKDDIAASGLYGRLKSNIEAIAKVARQ